MSKYTTEVRFICEEKAGLDESVGYSDVDAVIENSRTKIFGDFPIFDETYRPILEKKILKHYYTREICEETVGLWQLRLDTRMNEIMPYYNKLYKSELITFNPLYDVDLTTSRDKQGSSTGQTNSTETESGARTKAEILSGSKSEAENGSQHEKEVSNLTGSESESKAATSNDKASNDETLNKADNSVTSVGSANKGSSVKDDLKWDLYSDTPQGDVTGINGYMDNLDAKMYLTNARKNTDEETVKTENIENTNTVEVGDETTSKTVNGSNAKISNENGFSENEQNKTIDNDKVTNNVAESEHAENKSSAESNELEKNKNSNNVVNNIEDYFEHVVGKRGSMTYSKMLNDFRTTFLNIDKMIIEELSDLFFLLW